MSRPYVRDSNGSIEVSFYLPRRDGTGTDRIFLYPGLEHNRVNLRSARLKELNELIVLERWSELAERFPRPKKLAAYRTLPKNDLTTLRETCERFLAYQAKINRESTVIFYRDILRKHVLTAPEADKSVRLIGTSDVANIYSAVVEAGHVPQAQKVRRVLSAVFRWARGEHGVDGAYLVPNNPVELTPPIKRTDDYTVEPFTSEEIQRILAVASPGWERRLVIVAFGTGLEVGENFGLKRADIDFNEHVINVNQRWTRYRDGDLKNKRRRRAVNMTPAVETALREQIKSIELRSPWLWPDTDTLEPHNPQNFSRRNWPALLKRAEVKYRNVYQCRHSFATQLFIAGAEPRYIADQMGHTDLTMLQERYLKWRSGTTPRPSQEILNQAFACLG